MKKLVLLLVASVFVTACGGSGAVGSCEDIQSLCQDDTSEVGKAFAAIDCQAEYDKLSDAEKETADTKADESTCNEKETCSAAVNCSTKENSSSEGTTTTE